MKQYKCIMCGILFEAINDNAQTCSPICRSRRYATRHKKELLVKRCLICNTNFETNNPTYKYCNKKCAKIARYMQDSSNLQEKIKHNLRSRLYDALKGKLKVGSSVSGLGCSIKDLQKYLESKFEQEMSWDNYGFYGWHIDHIVPLSSFDLTDPEQFSKACHYTNLQPLWARDNLSKGIKNG